MVVPEIDKEGAHSESVYHDEGASPTGPALTQGQVPPARARRICFEQKVQEFRPPTDFRSGSTRAGGRARCRSASFARAPLPTSTERSPSVTECRPLSS